MEDRWFEEQKELLNSISPLPWYACGCGKCGQVSNNKDCIAVATMGDWGDDYPSIRRIGGSIEGKFETYMEQITYGNIPKETGHANAKYIEQACNNYPKALNEIQCLQTRVQELEAEQSEITQAFGLLTTLCPTMEIDTSDYMGMAKKIEEHVQKLEAEQRWIPVRERLPEDSRIYDVAIAGYQYSWTGSCVFGKWIGESGKAILGVTHWKYRPQLPKDNEL